MIPKGWTTLKLGELGKWIGGGTPSKNNVDFWTDGVIPWVSPKDMKSQRITTAEDYITQAAVKNSSTNMIPESSVLIVTRSGILRNIVPVAITSRPVTINQDMKALIPHNGYHSLYILYCLQNNNHQVRQECVKDGTTVESIDYSALKSFRIAMPGLPEQVAITDVIGSLDKNIDHLTLVTETKEHRRNALVQNLLVGKLRISGFTRQAGFKPTKPYPLPKDWTYTLIGNVCQECSARNTGAQDLPVLSCTKHQGLVSSLDYFGKRVFSEETSSYRLVPRNTFAYATNHIEEGSIGYQDLFDVALISPIYTVFKTSPEVDDAFLYRLLKTEWYRQLFQKHTNSSVDRRGSLRWSHFAAIPIPLPPLKEQQAIMEVLLDADREIALHRAELDALKRQKRGLMQQLLTGKVRVL